MNIQRITFGLIFSIALVFILSIGESILMPLIIAFIVWFVILKIQDYLSKIKIKGRGFPPLILKVLTLGVFLASFFLFSSILMNSAEGVQERIPVYQANLNTIIEDLHIPVDFDYKTNLTKLVQQFNISDILGTAISSVSVIFSTAIIILLYLLFILLESSSFTEKINKIYPNIKERSRIEGIIQSINKSMSSYLSLKTFTSFTTAFLSFIVLKIIGVDFAFFWAYLIFLLNFIPTIGSLIATIFPVLLAFLQFGTWVQPVIVLAAVGGIQTIVGNVLEPKLMGNSLNVSPLVVLISLAFWGKLWGVVGMIISVPIAIMIIIVCSQFADLKWLAILLSSDGNLPNLYNKDEV